MIITETPTIAPYEPGRQTLIVFRSTPEFLDAVARAKKHEGHFNHDSRTGHSSFTGSQSFDDALSLARNGWAKGLAAIEKARQTLPPITPKTPDDGTAPGWWFDVSGDELDVSRHLADDPEPFLVREPTEGEGKIISVTVSIALSCAVPTEAITKRGAMICAICSQLETAGYNVEIIIRWRTKFSRHCTMQTTFKRSDEPLELDRAAFFLTHASILRRLGFALLETQPDCPGNYGYPDDNDKPTFHKPGQTDIFLRGGGTENITVEETMRAFREAGLLT